MKSRLLKFVLFLGCLLVAIYVMDWVCPIERFFGIPCPGCGMSSALYHLLRGDWRSAYFFHPALFILIPIATVVFIGWLSDEYFLKSKAFKWLFGFCLVAYLLIYVYRMITIFPAWPMQYVEENVLQNIWSLIHK